MTVGKTEKCKHVFKSMVMENGRKTCRSCKIISICCPVAVGCYLIHTGKSYEKKSKMIINVLGLGKNYAKLHNYFLLVLISRYNSTWSSPNWQSQILNVFCDTINMTNNL